MQKLLPLLQRRQCKGNGNGWQICWQRSRWLDSASSTSTGTKQQADIESGAMVVVMAVCYVCPVCLQFLLCSSFTQWQEKCTLAAWAMGTAMGISRLETHCHRLPCTQLVLSAVSLCDCGQKWLPTLPALSVDPLLANVMRQQRAIEQ